MVVAVAGVASMSSLHATRFIPGVAILHGPNDIGGLAIGVFEALWDGYFPNAWRDGATYLALCALLIATRRQGGTER